MNIPLRTLSKIAHKHVMLLANRISRYTTSRNGVKAESSTQGSLPSFYIRNQVIYNPIASQIHRAPLKAIGFASPRLLKPHTVCAISPTQTISKRNFSNYGFGRSFFENAFRTNVVYQIAGVNVFVFLLWNVCTRSLITGYYLIFIEDIWKYKNW